MISLSEQYAWQGYALAEVAPAFPLEWEQQVQRIAGLYGLSIRKQGRGPGSLEPEESAGLNYHVVDGFLIRHYLGWLDRWYRGEGLALASSAFGWEVFPSEQERSALNINCLQGPGGRYELHTDSGHSALLFVTTHEAGDGGELFLDPPGHTPVWIRPRAGQIVFFDGSVTPHGVMPLLVEKQRISIPFAFTSKRLAARPPDLDSYLFSSSSSSNTALEAEAGDDPSSQRI